MTTQEHRLAREADEDARVMEMLAHRYRLRGHGKMSTYWQQQAEAAREQARRYRERNAR